MADARLRATWRLEDSDTRVAFAILALVAVRLVAAALIDLGADESYYLLWSRHPSFGYYDHPPMVAWWIVAGTAVFGDSPFGVRVLFVLSAIPTTYAVWLIGRRLFDRETAALAALWINATLLFGVGGISATPDAPAILFWTLAVWAFVVATDTRNGVWWLAVGLFAGLGVLSKLTDLFLGLGLLAAMIARRDLRGWLASPWFWTGGVVAAAVVAPLALWNAGHDWMTFASQFSRVTRSGFEPLRLPEMIATQFALLNPLIAVFVGLAAAAWVRRLNAYPLVGIDRVLWIAAPLIAYMAWHALRAQVQAHWLAPVYPMLVLAGTATATAPPAAAWDQLRKLAFPAGVVLSLVGLLLAANPGGLLPPQLDPGRANHGWEGIAADVERLRIEAGADWIATTNYAADAIIAYHLRAASTPVVPVVERRRYAFAPPPDPSFLDRPALILMREADLPRLAGCFGEIMPIGTIERRSGDNPIQTLAALKVAGARPDLFETGCW